MDALIDFGRPKRIELAVLVDRGHRELPICADYVGTSVSTALDEVVNVYMKEAEEEDRVVVEKK
jgi:pyrimidine operon attenuation protein/uracil phosphoribosyltransferase